jgi:hypothetical protein
MTIDYAVNIATVRKFALPQHVESGSVWYRRAQQIALEVSPESALRGAGVLACFSPRMPWPLTVRQTRAAFSYGTAAGHKPALHTRAMVRSADRIIRWYPVLEVLKGDKTRAFAVAIATGGSEGIAVIDRHAHDIAMGHFDFDDTTRNIGKRLYRTLAGAYQEVADYYGEPVHETQAITWEAWRTYKGVPNVWMQQSWLIGTPETGMAVSVPA